jgi:hypothetical protein
LLHVVTNLICTFLVSLQLVLFSGLPKFLHSVCDRKVCTRLFFRKISSQLMSVAFILFFWGSKFRFHIEEWGDPVIVHFCSWRVLGQIWFNIAV